MEIPSVAQQGAIAKAQQTKYHTAIGRLILKWADTELALYKVLLFYCEMDEKVGRALLSGARASAMIDFLLALADNIKIPEDRLANIKFITPQLRAINTMRDKIAHNGLWGFTASFPSDGKFAQRISNKARVNREANSFTIAVGAESIDFMVKDLLVIDAHLRQHLNNGEFQIHALFDFDAWFYKSPQPVHQNRK